MPSPPHSPLSPAMSLLSAPFLPWRFATITCNKFSHRFYLLPPSSWCHCRRFPCATASFRHHILLQDRHIHLSCPLTPLCSLYITSYLNSQLFSWLNKPRTSYSKVIRVLLESYVTTWLFWSPFTSPLPADKGPEFLFIYVNSLFYWAGILSAISALRQSHSAGSVLCVIWLCFLSLLWQAHCEV